MDVWVNKVRERIKNKIKSLKKAKQIDIFPVLQDEQVRQYLKDFQTKFCIDPIDKASSKFLFICKKNLCF